VRTQKLPRYVRSASGDLGHPPHGQSGIGESVRSLAQGGHAHRADLPRPQGRELHSAAEGVAQLHDRVALRYDRASEGWLSSDARKRLLVEIEPYLEGGDQVENTTGLEFWFTPPDSEQKQVKRYKQFLVTWSVIFPLTIFVPWVLHPVFQTIPFSACQSSAILSSLV
jgi:antibiotic biosynthesis monooxygenase (ABM) superfamily enzyme